MTRPKITLTREDGKLVCVFVDSVAMVELPIPEAPPGSRSRVMISGAYRYFEESVAEVLKLLREAR